MQEINAILSYQKYKNANIIFELLKSKPHAVIKGEPLSLLAYGKCGKRHLGDIDLLIDRKELQFLENTLLENGFNTSIQSRADKVMMLSYSHQIAPYIKEIPPYKNVMIDINFDIFWGEYEGNRVDITEFLSDTIDLEIYGFRIKSLTPLKTVVQMMLHQYKDMNSLYILCERKKYNINGLKDIYYLLKSHSNDLSLNKLYDISEHYNIIPYVYYILFHVGIIFKDNFIDCCIKEFETNEGIYLLNCYGLNDSERHEWKTGVLTRINSMNLYHIIKNDLTERDRKKIEMNRRMF